MRKQDVADVNDMADDDFYTSLACIGEALDDEDHERAAILSVRTLAVELNALRTTIALAILKKK